MIKNVYVLLIFSTIMLLGCKNSSPTTPYSENTITETKYGFFPRFLHNYQEKTTTDILILYSTDDIFSTYTWDNIGYPDKGLFRLHKEWPQLKYTVQLVVANRYLGDDHPKLHILDDPDAKQLWLDLHTKEEFREWMEFGNHGYYHSPKGDPNLDHHEFNGEVNPNANDFDWCDTVFKNARSVYEEIGLNNEEILVMRFPGYKYTQEALQALVENNIIAFSDYHNESGSEKWILLENGEYILQIPDIVYGFKTEQKDFVEKIHSSVITVDNYASHSDYLAVKENLIDFVNANAKSGGVVAFFDHWWEHNQDVNGFNYRLELLKEAINHLIEEYGNDKIWWGFTSELARFAYIKRFAKVSENNKGDTLLVSIDLESKKWPSGWDMPISYTLDHEKVSANVEDVVVKEIFWKSQDMNEAQKLENKFWWAENHFTHITFPFSGPATELIITFD